MNSSYSQYQITLNFLAPANRLKAQLEYYFIYMGIQQWEPNDEQLWSFRLHLSEIERSGPYGEPYIGPHPPYADIAQSSWLRFRGNIIPLSNENRNDPPLASPTNYFYFVFSHLQGVQAPKIFPFSDFAISSVSPYPAHISLKAELWKLCSLALKIILADTTVLLACDNIAPIFLSSYLGKTADASLNILSTMI